MLERTERLDFELLLDRLDEVIGAAARVPFGSKVMVDQQDCASIISQMRITLPGQLEEARRIIAERDSILEQARAESERMVMLAQQQVTQEALTHEITREARALAAQIEQRAEDDARRVRAETDDYARQVLQRLTGRVEGTLRALKTGMLELDRSRGHGEHRGNVDSASPPERRARTGRGAPLEPPDEYLDLPAERG